MSQLIPPPIKIAAERESIAVIGSEDANAIPLTDSSSTRFGHRVGFYLINAWLVFHLVGVFLPAFSIPPSPAIVRELYWSLRFYPQAIYMDHGYHFFGPDPGDSTLLRYVAKNANGETVRGTYPNKNVFPRLRYHRHFMLTEAIPRVADFDESLADLQAKSYAERLLKHHGAQSIRLFRVTHRMTSSDRYLAGGRLDDPETYNDESMGTFAIEADASVVQR